MICSDCDAAICAGGCSHATELFASEPRFWDEDDVGNRGAEGDFGSITEKRARELIREWNGYGRKKYKGCLGILEKEEI